MEYLDYVAELRDDHLDWAIDFARFDGIMHVLDWMQANDLTRAGVDMVSHDEFNYDFLIPLPDQRWLVFGVN